MLTWNTTTGNLGSFREGTYLNVDLGVTGGVLPYTLEVLSFFLPLSVTVDTNSFRLVGQLPNEKSTTEYSVTVLMSDSSNQTLVGTFYFISTNDASSPTWPDYPVNDNVRLIDLGTTFAGQPMPDLLPAFDVDASLGQTTLSYSLLNGSLPNGIVLNSNGSFTGRTSDINQSEQVYVFTIRASNGLNDIDREFKIQITTLTDVPIWLMPPGYVGTVQALAYNILILDAKDPVFSELTYTITAGILPDGLSLSSNGIISGIPTQDIQVSYNVTFTVSVSNGLSSVSQTFILTVVPKQTTAVTTIPVWPNLNGQSEPVNLGSIYEFTNSYFSVSAANATSYSLAPYSSNLPLGMTLDSTTGEILGFAGAVSGNTTYIFTIRAFTAIAMVDRTFQITILERTTATTPGFVYIDVTGRNRQLISYGVRQIASALPDLIFKPNDPNYGAQPLPRMYIYGGVDNLSQASLWSAIIRPGTTDTYSFTHRTTIFTDGLNVASYIDPDGNKIYDVIYYNMIDSQNGGGTFASNVPQPIPPFTNTVGLDDFYISNFVSWRDVLINAFPNTTELMPEWMSCQQTFGDPTTVIGWVPAAPILYTLPGKAQQVLSYASVNENPIINFNMMWEVGSYILRGISIQNTTFDSGSTTFDYATTTFITESYNDQVLYFPPGQNTLE